MFASAKDCGLAGVKMNCRVWEPNNYKPGTSYPLIVYLHGAGQAGYSSDSAENERVIENTRNWAAMLTGVINEETGRTNGEYFVILPQAPDSETQNGGAYVQWDWGQKASYKLAATPESTTLKTARAMIAGVQKKYNIDGDRLYVIGSSMGGFGTWDLIARNPTLFAAGLPNAGGGPPDGAVGLRNMAIWSHHNDGDGAVPVDSDREMFKAVALAGGRPIYTETVSKDHTDGGVLGNGNFFPWMLAQRRGIAATTNKSLAFNPPGGALKSPVTVTITSDQGQNIRYTLDGTVPSASKGIVYKGPITLSTSAILMAMVDSGEQKTFHAAPFAVDGMPLPMGAAIDDTAPAPLAKPGTGGSGGGTAIPAGGSAGTTGAGGVAGGGGGTGSKSGGESGAAGVAGGKGGGSPSETDSPGLPDSSRPSGCLMAGRRARAGAGGGLTSSLLAIGVIAWLRRRRPKTCLAPNPEI